MTPEKSRIETILGEISARKAEPNAVARLAREALQEMRQEDNPQLWAGLQGMLASSLVSAAAGHLDAERVGDIRAAYQAALSVFDPQSTSEIWLETQCNLADTYMLALRNGIGNSVEQVEAAIAAYEKALALGRRESVPSLWLNCQVELSGLLCCAAAWRGPEALRQATPLCEEALQALKREESPDTWATVSLNLGRCLIQAGALTSDAVERAIRACEDALPRFDPATRAWAEAHLVLGEAYRRRPLGKCQDNIERAILSIEHALTVFTRETTSAEWYRAHYQRGPLYAYRTGGAPGENLERSIESLKIAIGMTSRQQAPEAWASLQLVLGEVYGRRIAGDLEANSASAAAAFEAVLEVATPARWPKLWLRASRSLAEVYLAGGGRETQPERLERAITLLEQAQADAHSREVIAHWCVAQLNLATAYLQRGREEECNREQARRCLEQALAEPVRDWVSFEVWEIAQAKLAIELLAAPSNASVEDRLAPATDSDSTPVAGEPADDAGTESMTPAEWRAAGDEWFYPAFFLDLAATAGQAGKRSDAFDLAGMARKQLAALGVAQRSGVRPLENDSDWHVPFLLNEEAALLSAEFWRFVENQKIWLRTPEERAGLERRRLQMVRLVLDHLVEKYDEAGRTEALFREVEEGKRAFILFLRGFALRARRYEGVQINHGGGPATHEMVERPRLARLLAPVPLLWVANPVDSGPLEAAKAVMLARMADPDRGWQEDTPGFRIEMGADWETGIRGLISAASFIVIHNPEPTPGVAMEVQLVEALGRRADAFFYSPEQAAEILKIKVKDCTPFHDKAIEQMRSAAVRPGLTAGSLPPATCLWVSGDMRTRVERQVAALWSWTNHLPAGETTAAALDLRMDTCVHLLGQTLLLERLDLAQPIVLSIAATLRSLGEAHLSGADSLADRYASYAAKLAPAIAQYPEGSSLIAKTARILQALQAPQA
jgi:tetratricopeptide (TPR) repeat protein